MKFESHKKYMKELLTNNRFLIPEYQRPYKWIAKEQCETLWQDIEGLFNKDSEEDYFLGSIVVFENKEEKRYEVIDGQQRITTFILLFRACYESLKHEKENDYTKDFGKCIWKYINNKGFQYNDYILDSKVFTDNDSIIFKQLLKQDCEIDNNQDSNYVKNYNYFINKIEEIRKDKALSINKFYNILLEKLFILLVICDDQESAMTIFNTLNSRGLPLANADILKGFIYKNISNKNDFINIWKDIEEIIENNKSFNMDFLFLEYMHIIRAENKDRDNTIPSMLNFFTKDGDKNYGFKDGWLYKDETMPFILNLANFWSNTENYLSDKAKKYIKVLNVFQNNTWKSFISCLVYKNKMYFDNEFFDKDNFSKDFEKYLPKLIKYITIEYLHNTATTNRIRDLIIQMNINLKENTEFEYKNNTPSKEIFIGNLSNKITSQIKYFLLLYAYIYNDFNENINPENEKLEVEHILPKKWQNANFNDWNKENHEEYIEKIGNKILLDKSTNIKCADGFFAKKQEYYKNSKINSKEIKDLAYKSNSNWIAEDIKARENQMYEKFIDFFKNV